MFRKGIHLLTAFIIVLGMLALFSLQQPTSADFSPQQNERKGFSVEHHDVYKVIATSDKKKMISMSFDGFIKIWDLNTGEILHDFRSLADLKDVQLNSDETKLLSYGRAGHVQIWDIITGQELYHHAYEFQLFGAKWYEDDNSVIVWGVGNVAIGDIASGNDQYIVKCELSIPSQCGVFYTLDWNDTSIVVNSGKKVQVFDRDTGNEKYQFNHDTSVQGMQFNQDRTLLLTWTWNNSLWVWDITTGEIVNNYIHRLGVNGATWQTTTNHVFSWAYTAVQVWDLDRDEPILRVDLEGDMLGSVFSPTADLMASWIPEGNGLRMIIWDTTTGDKVRQIESDIYPQVIAWHSEDLLFTLAYTPKFIIWDTHTGTVIHELSHNGEIIGSLWIEDNLILTWGRHGKIKLWRLEK